MKHIWIICLLVVCSCNTVKEDFAVNEDYEKLFPPKEIEKPANKRGELFVQLCDPNQALEGYQYPGTETPDDAEQYKITLICSFQEKSWDGNLTNDVIAQYKVKYINEKKELVTISCGKKSAGVAREDTGRLIPNVMYNGEKLEISFNVHSGFPLYLCVTGEGPRSSNIKASIKAVSIDGLIEIPGLETEQYQNEEGINPLRYPYCEYLILP